MDHVYSEEQVGVFIRVLFLLKHELFGNSCELFWPVVICHEGLAHFKERRVDSVASLDEAQQIHSFFSRFFRADDE